MPKPKAGNPTPELEFCRAEEAEKGLVSVILNNPDQALLKITESAFSVDDIFDIKLRKIAGITLQQAAQAKATDIRVIYELVRKDTHLEFYELSELYTACPILSLLPEFIDLTRTAAKRRTMQIVLHNAQTEVRGGDLNEFLSGLVAVSEGVQNEIAPPKVLDTRTQLMEATRRYETGDDGSRLVKTGFPEIDNLVPIHETDFIIIGGETKSGKTTFVLNILLNIIENIKRNEANQLNSTQN
jgi:replicative DNA helicase